MAEINPRRNGEILRAVFQILVNETDGHRRSNALLGPRPGAELARGARRP